MSMRTEIKIRSGTKARRAFKYRHALSGYLCILPAFVFLAVFSFTPLFMAIRRSFVSFSTGAFVGFDNFRYILQTPTFTKSFGNVLLLAGIVVATQMVFSFLMAHLLLKLPRRWSGAVKIGIYLPCMMSAVVTSVIFNLFLRFNRGFFDAILSHLNKDPIYFAQDGLWPYVCIIVPTLWLGFGYNTLVMLAGRLSIPKEYYEAAKIDGAGVFYMVFKITIPNMGNFFILMLVNLIIGNLQMLELPMFITGGGPHEKTITPTMYLFQSFNDMMRDRNITIAGSLLVMVPIVAINILAFTLIRSRRSGDA
jgi:ABC-type sugar transport system permease subunit